MIPVQPLAKHTYLKGNDSSRGTLDPAQVHRWDTENPNYNVGSLGSFDGACLFDCDAKGLVAEIEKETGSKMPVTFTVKSANKGTAHLYFKHTDRSRALGNKTHRAGEVRGDNEYVVGPGSEIVCDDGTRRKYEIYRDVDLVPFPDFLVDWVIANPATAKTKTGQSRTDDTAFQVLKNALHVRGNTDDLLLIEDLLITDLHGTLKALCAHLYDGERSEDEITEVLRDVGQKYGHRAPEKKDEKCCYVVQRCRSLRMPQV